MGKNFDPTGGRHGRPRLSGAPVAIKNIRKRGVEADDRDKRKIDEVAGAYDRLVERGIIAAPEEGAESPEPADE